MPHISAFSIACSFCGAQPYESCVRIDTKRRCQGLHGARMRDADDATKALNALVNS